ncbi:MAG TPA: T9SS type A sorting domain-containing protein [Ignavibacteria bacterium]|nr:T9SS type A sorting domain-containing protein [Ignavibacteria bacterium]
MYKKIFTLFIILSGLAAGNLFPQEKMISKTKGFLPPVFEKFAVSNTPVTVSNVSTKFGILSVYSNQNIFPSSVNQSTISSVIQRNNPQVIFLGANTDLGVGYYYSVNGGSQWFGADYLPSSLVYSTNPSVAINSLGNFYYNYFDTYLVVDKSLNQGANWLGRVILPASNGFDGNSLAVDPLASSAYNGRVYNAYTRWSPPYPVVVSYSTDGGNNFLPEVQVSSPSANHINQGAKIQTGPNGEIYCVWAEVNLLNNNIEDKIGFSKSLNGGAGWTTPVNPLTISGIRGTLLSSNIRVNSFPSLAVDCSGGARNGYIYLAWAQKGLSPAGSDADICFAYSSDGGSTFSAPVRVNTDALNNGSQQFMPAITCDQTTGDIEIVFYDTRDFSSQDSCNTYLALSNNGGANWINVNISDAPQSPKPLAGYAEGYYSDYISVSAQGGVIYPFWTDNRTGAAQIFSSRVTAGPFIAHTKLKDTENLTGPYTVNAVITPFGSPVQSGSSKVFWGRGTISDSVVMTNSSGSNWTANIPGSGSAASYRYYIKATDNSGRTSYSPADAPSVYYSFYAGADTVKPVIKVYPQHDTLRAAWPLTLKSKVTDNISVDSVWCKWYINTPSGGYREFKMNNLSGDIYSGAFNAPVTQILNGDSIFYRVYAKDLTSQHNVDSSSLYMFRIIGNAVIFIGSGNQSLSYPFFTFYTDARTDLLYLASELTSHGAAQGALKYIGFDFVNAAPMTIYNLVIKVQTTSQTTLGSFTNSNWFTVYSGNYVPQGTGWQYILFTSPYQWDGTGNLLIEVCYNNDSFGENNTVKGTLMTSMVWHQHADLPNGDGCTDLTAGASQSARPNVALGFTLQVGVEEHFATMPKDYLLYQNYPNPFNPVTKIHYAVPSKSFVQLKVYDMLGREISTLVNSSKDAGDYILEYDASSLSSGIYFYKMQAGKFSAIRKMVVIK